MSNLQEAEARAALIAKELLPLIAAALVRKAEPRPLSPKEEAIMVACGELGRAVDRLEQVKFTAAERRARITLETTARNLRKLIDLREAKHARK
ncbi:hypothetical protein FJ422_16495 [Mesorhizobium sp. B2-6-3]|uniref:hypothetical protein n=1 Tax=Mesorhizobium sp. B2-6-3 TaxID=2589914 RepID=UPI00112EA31B|nr:hypothetical protein [Mesorhizobium sp. B2-6-3]TPJ83871.1 hypothetical protein FJ422_16495 [Mesorhizobium sp. B2-6-3]